MSDLPPTCVDASSIFAIVPFAATGAAAELQALADDRMREKRIVAFPGTDAGEVVVLQRPGTALGAYAWRAGIELVLYLNKAFGSELANFRILELGSGTGLTAIALCRLGARVVGTDMMPDLVKLARTNMSANSVPLDRCTAHIYEWGKPMPAVLRGLFDMVVASEVTALEGGKDSLIATLQVIVENNRTAGSVPPCIFLAETRRNTQQPIFWAQAAETFTAEEVAVVSQSDTWNTLDREEPVRIVKLRPREPAVVESGSLVFDSATSTQLVVMQELVADAPDVARAYGEIFKKEERLDGYGMSMDDMEIFKSYGYVAQDVGKLSTYGAVLHHGVPLLFQAVAHGAYGGDLFAAVDGKVFLDLGSADGRCVISAALHFCGLGGVSVGGSSCFPRLKKAVGVELSKLRHDLALKFCDRATDIAVRETVHLMHDDILSEKTAKSITEADIIYAANLRFPPEVNARLGSQIAAAMDPDRDYFVLTLATPSFGNRSPAASWDVMVPMTWNASGWPVTCHHFPRSSM